MRDLSPTLLAAQESAELEPKVKITFSLAGEDDIVIEQDRILRIPSQEETTDSHVTEVICDNSDGYFTSLALKGWDAVLERGLVTAIGAEYSAVAPLKVISQYLPSAPGVLQCRLSLIGIPNLLAEDKASKDYFHHWSDTKKVKAMITEIADGHPVSTELTEEQTKVDSYIDLKDGIHGAGQRRLIKKTVTKLAFRLKKTGLPTGTNVTFRIWDVEADAPLASKTFPIASISTSPAWCEVTFDSPVEVDQDVWIYCEHTAGTATKYISVSYNSVAIKPEEWFMQVNAAGDPVTEWADRDCAYRYKYTEAGIDCWERGTSPETYCESYEVVYDSEDSLIDVYMPKDAFRIYEGQSRLDKINQLLGYTGCAKIVKADGKLHIFVPKSSEPFDSLYSLDEGHTFFSKAVREALIIPSRIVVKSLKTDEDQYSGAATSPVSYALLPITGAPIRTKLVDGAQGKSIAEAKIARLEMAAQRGAASVPNNLGSEVFDYVKVTDSRQGDSRVGNLGYIRRSYDGRSQDAKEACPMDFSFGRVRIKGVPGARPSLMPEAMAMPEPTLEEAILRWGMIKPILEIIEQNFDDVWGVEGGQSLEVLGEDASIAGLWRKLIEIYTALGWFEGETPTDTQILLALLNYYTKAQVDAKGYLKNLIEDLTPQLGGNLDTDGKYIQYGDFKILLAADKIWFLTPDMVFQLTPTGALLQVPLAMNNEKITGLGAPAANADAATKKYVDDNVGGGLENVVEDLTPQLGGDLDTNGKYIEFGDFKILLAADRIWFLTPSMVFQLTPTGAKLQQPLDMTNKKITGLAAPTTNSGAATKQYVDDGVAAVAGKLDDCSHSEPSRSIDTIYQYTGGGILIITVSVHVQDGDGCVAQIGSGSPPASQVTEVFTQHTDADTDYRAFTFVVPNNYYYRVATRAASGTPNLREWHEWDLH